MSRDGNKVSWASFAQLNLSIVIMGNVTLFAKMLPFSPSTIIFGRAFFSVILLGAFLKFRGKDLWIKQKWDLFKLLAIGFIFAIHWVTYFHSLQVSSIAVGMLALFTYPVFTSILEPLYAGTRPDFLSVFLAIFSLFGLYFITPEFSLENSTFLGVIWGLISAVLYSLRNILTKEMQVHYSSAHILWVQLLATAFVLFPFTDGLLEMVSNPVYLLYQLILAGFFTALAHTLWIKSFKEISVTTAGLMSMISPFYGILSAWFFLGEAPPDKLWIGGGIVLFGSVFEIWRKAK